MDTLYSFYYSLCNMIGLHRKDIYNTKELFFNNRFLRDNKYRR